MIELKPCPFCGGENVKIFSFYDGGICVKCLDCRCQTEGECDCTISDAMNQSAYEKVVSAWNRRVGDSDDE